MSGPVRIARLAGWLAAGVSVFLPMPAVGQFSRWATFPLQYVDARVLPAGALRIGFLPSYANYSERFSADGTVEPLGADLTADTLGSNLLVTLLSAEQAVRSATRDTTYRMTLGPIRTLLDADVRRIPLDLALGLSNGITLTARVSLVKTRMQAFVTLDSTKGNVGWNQTTSQANNASGAAQIATLLSQLAAAIQSLSSRIAAGNYGCPGSASCTPAMSTLARAQVLLNSLTTLTPGAGAATQVPVAPLSASPAGTALRSEVTAVVAALQGLGVGPVGGSLVLPTKSLSADNFQTLLGAPEFGYEARPLATTDISRLGDTEVGLRVGLVQRPTLRLVLHGTVRLPTAARDSTAHLVDLGTGDGQFDAAVGLEAALETSGGLGLSAGAGFTRQFADDVTRRLESGRPFPGSGEGQFRRDLGDVLQVSAYPSLRLSDAFRVFGSVYYFRKTSDSLEFLSSAVPGAAPAVLPAAAQRALYLGAGIHYRAERTAAETVKLPVEAGLSYQAAFRGPGGMTPKTTMLNLYLRLYYRVFGTGN